MKKILLVYLPFCTPVSPPYSVTHFYSFLKNNSDHNISLLDLNLEFHILRFPEYHQYYRKTDWKDYEKVSTEYTQLTMKTYSENNKRILINKKPEFFDELMQKIKEQNPDIIAFSIVYSSQAFYAYSILKELQNYTTVIGGPAVNEKLRSIASKTLNNEVELLEFIENKKIDHNNLIIDSPIDFSQLKLSQYFTPKPVISIRTSSSCYYRRCAFCAHYSKVPYYEYPLDSIKETIVNSKQRYFFLMDDMIPLKRLIELGKLFRELKIRWICQLRPTKDYNYESLKILNESGLIAVWWGIESGNQRVLDMICKGTNIEDIEKVMENSKRAGIINAAYILFGFPTETREEFLETIAFLEKNKDNIDLISASVFGLHKGTPVYNNPEKYKINIIEENRTLLEPKISYIAKEGLTQKRASYHRKKNMKKINSMNRFPKSINFFREHMFFYN